MNEQSILSNLKYEYYLYFWGQINNKDENWIVKDLGINEKDFWFDSKEERLSFKKKLEDIANKHQVIICFREEEGLGVRFKTIATMKFIHTNGKLYYYRDDNFGYGFSADSARYMFERGNYSCDCNRSLFLSREHKEIKEMECGDKIKMVDFKILYER